MSYIEQAIKEAVEEGAYHCKGALKEEGLGTPTWSVAPGNIFVVRKVVIGFGGDPAQIRQEIQFWEIALDCAFWQALGKARGWEQYLPIEYQFPIPPDQNGGWRDKTMRIPEWQYHWHRFIDHIATGKDAESFFAALFEPSSTTV